MKIVNDYIKYRKKSMKKYDEKTHLEILRLMAEDRIVLEKYTEWLLNHVLKKFRK